MTEVVGAFYRAMSLDELRAYRDAGSLIPAEKSWAGLKSYTRRSGRRVINRMLGWVEDGGSPYGAYHVLVSCQTPVREFGSDTLESEVYHNRHPVPLGDVTVESVHASVGWQELTGLRLHERVERLYHARGDAHA